MGLHPRREPRALRHIAMQTDAGMVRERNEDAAYIDLEGWFVIVADGMGDRGCGELASSMAVTTVREVLEQARPILLELVHAPATMRRAWVRGLLERAVRRANREAFERGDGGMGTTIEVLLMVGTDGPAMVELARTRGGRDDITAIIVEPWDPVIDWDDQTTPWFPDAMRRAHGSASDESLTCLIDQMLNEHSEPVRAAPRPRPVKGHG